MNPLFSKLITHRNTSILACVLISIVILDLFILPHSSKTEILGNSTVDRQKEKNDTYHVYYFITRDNNQYKVPQYLYNTILVGDTFTVAKTPVFKRNASVQWCKENRCYKMNIGIFNAQTVSYWLIGILLCVSLLFSLNMVSFKKSRFKTYNYIILGASVGIFIVYAFFS